MRAATERQHQHRRRTVDRVTGAHLPRARLQEVGSRGILFGRHGTRDGKEAADRHVDIDVRRTAERVEGQQILSPRILDRTQMDVLQLFRQHGRHVTAPLVGAQKDALAQHIQRLLPLALHIDCGATGIVTAECVGQTAKGDPAGNRLAGECHVRNKTVQITGGVRMTAAFFDRELDQGTASARGHHVLRYSIVRGAGQSPLRCPLLRPLGLT